ncbi:hypothetical protein EUGRSUZ_C00429 [Eucalyptus grandis]|uniref:Uncharacterized protein n=2 Tax=Eucalyptus grandis TaxID=71139 RepID=A0ACC3LA26_EUCGR|nr:hypothetical protein EUGRSUZ_C00429 [Eucalyptus grandis]
MPKIANSFLSILNLQSPASDLKQESSISSVDWAEKSQSRGRGTNISSVASLFPAQDNLFQSLRVHMLTGQLTNEALSIHNFVGCLSC